MTPTPPRGSATTTVRAGTQAEADYVNELADREIAGELIMAATGPHSLLIVICGLRLAAAHPGMPAWERSVLLAYAGKWTELYVGTPAEDLAVTGTMPTGMDLEAETDQ